MVWISGIKFVWPSPVRDCLPERHGKFRVCVRGCVTWFIVTSPSPGAAHIKLSMRHLINSSRNPMEETWAVQRQCRSQGTMGKFRFSISHTENLFFLLYTYDICSQSHGFLWLWFWMRFRMIPVTLPRKCPPPAHWKRVGNEHSFFLRVL